MMYTVISYGAPIRSEADYNDALKIALHDVHQRRKQKQDWHIEICTDYGKPSQTTIFKDIKP